MMNFTVDTSVLADLVLEYDEKRTRIAEDVVGSISHCTIINPSLVMVELAGLLVRKFQPQEVEKMVADILEEIVCVNNPDDMAYRIALETGSRAADAYFIATAKMANSILLTNDRIMAENAKRVGVEAYYLLEEFDAVIKRIAGL